MSTLSSIYTSMTSLLSFSRALDVISDNVANLNTPGFKATDLQFTSIPSSYGDLGDVSGKGGIGGSGSDVELAGRRFSQGEIQETGTATHLAVDGRGFFVMILDGEQIYTRFGQFELDESGRLIDQQSGAVLQSLEDGTLKDFVINLGQVSAASGTTTVSLGGNLSTGDDAHTVENITIIDADGQSRELTIDFTNATEATPGAWQVSVKGEDGEEIRSGEVRFDSSGTPLAGFNTIDIEIAAASGKRSTVTFDFGLPGTLDGASSVAAGDTSTLSASKTDGFAAGNITSFAFDASGSARLSFSNGQTAQAGQVALATFATDEQLATDDGRLFSNPSGRQANLGVAQVGGLGRIAPSSLELANVELAREFADIIILQRGYQASSQVLNVSSQMIEDVYNSLSGRG